jgi:pimeloyl-ACP methyl ester carboxylesterase
MSVSQALGEQRELELAQGTIRYRERGSGPPIVFVHGALVNGDLWRRVVPLLADDFRCITPDWPLGSHTVALDPGADLSPPGVARIVAGFIEALGLEAVTLVGNDTGGAICQIVVANHPEPIGRLVLTPCDGFEVFPPQPFAAVFGFAGRVPGALFALAQSMRLPLARRLPVAYGALSNRPPEREVSDAWVDPLIHDAAVRRDFGKVLKEVSTEHTLAAARKLGSFDRPVLLAWSDDRFFKLELGRRIAAAFPNARLEVVPDARTFVPEDQPQRLASLIREFAAPGAPTPGG